MHSISTPHKSGKGFTKAKQPCLHNQTSQKLQIILEVSMLMVS